MQSAAMGEAAVGVDARRTLATQSAHVLIVDDEPRQRTSMAELIALRGYRVSTACGGSDALQQLDTARFDVILLDVRMPRVDGHQVLEYVRDKQIDSAVIVISGDPTTDDARRAFKAGADDYLRKPCAPEQIYAALENSLGKRALVAENQLIRRRLEQSERLHRLIVNHSPDLMFILDNRQCIRFVNQAADFVLGYKPSALVGKPFESLLEPEHHQQARRLFEMPVDRPELRSAELPLRPRQADVRARTFELLAMPLVLHAIDGAFPEVTDAQSGGAYVVARDIEVRKRNEAQIRESQSRFRDYAELGADCLWECAADGRLVFVTKTFERCFSPREHVIGKPLIEVLRSSVGQHPALMRVADAMERQELFSVEFDNLGPQHPALSVLVSGKPVFDDRGRIVGMRGIGRDVSELRRQASELREYRERLETLVRRRTRDLEAVNRELESFSSSVSHDLRTPLRAIAGYSSILIEEFGPALGESGRGYLARIERASGRMAALIDELLALSRVTRQSIDRQPLDLGELAMEIDAMLREQAPDRHVLFEVQRPLLDNADPRLMRILLHNLLDNAWKYTRPRDTARIWLRCNRVNGQKVYEVGDNGVGFDPQHAGKLFGAFERLHADAEFEGTGIGLATVARIVRRHDGRVWASARLDAGAEIRFTLADLPQDSQSSDEEAKPHL